MHLYLWTLADPCLVEAQRTEAQSWAKGAMVREGPQEGPPEQGPEGRGGKEAEQTGVVKTRHSEERG